MRRSRIVVAVVVVLALVLVLWKLRSSDPSAPDSESSGDSAASSNGSTGARRTGSLTPAAPASVSGRVTRKADGAPIAGAIVSISRAEMGAMFAPDDQPTAVATTDASGAWTISPVAPGAYEVAATATGFVPGVRDKLAIAAGSRLTVDLALASGGTAVTGTVSDVGGGPIGGARITMQSDTAMLGGKPELIALTGADGRYQISLADGSYRASASHDDYTRASRSLELTGKPQQVDFTLAPGGVIRGQVVSRDGAPMPGALVHAQGGRGRFQQGMRAPVIADAGGNFTVRSLQSGAISLTAAGRGYVSATPTVVELGIGEQLEGVRVVVDRGLSISGRVVRAGKPSEGVAGVRLGVFSIGSGATSVAVDPSGDDGSFEIYGIRPASYMIFAIGDGVIPEIGKSIELVDKDITNFIIEMATGTTLSGRVDPGTTASLAIELENADKIGIATMFEAVKAMIVHADSDDTGAFTLKSVPPGSYRIVATAADGRKGKLAVTVTAADQMGLVVKLEPRASLAGRVVDASGAAVVGVRVSIQSPGGRGMRGFSMNSRSMGGAGATTGVDGAFREVGLDAGKYDVSVADDQGKLLWARGDKKTEPQSFELATGQELTNVTLTIESRDGVIRGVVIGADGKPAPDAWVTPRLDVKADPMDFMMMMRQPTQPALTDGDGRFTITRLRRGTYELVAEGPRGVSRTSKSGVKTGDSVTLTLASLGSLAGIVTAGGNPVAEYDISCRPESLGIRFGSGAELQKRITAKDGAYTFERLVPAEYTCSATATAGTTVNKATVATERVELDLALAPWASVTGVVVSEVSGQPVPGMNVMAGGDGFDQQSMSDIISGKGPKTDATGRFVIERVAPGKGRMRVVPPNASFDTGQLAKRDYTAVAGQRVDVGTIKIVPPRMGEAGTLGFSTEVDDGNLKIAVVKPGGPAEQSGITIGDRIVSIDGRLVSDLGIEIARALVASGSMTTGQRVVLGIERGGTPSQIPIVAARW